MSDVQIASAQWLSVQVKYGHRRWCEKCHVEYFAKNCVSRWCPICRPTEAPKAMREARERYYRGQRAISERLTA